MHRTVGELAEVAGVTVRTLHHWDAIGLLRPAERSGAAHRRYSPADVRRLHTSVNRVYAQEPTRGGMLPEVLEYVRRAFDSQ
jgi:hypothetical protein